MRTSSNATALLRTRRVQRLGICEVRRPKLSATGDSRWMANGSHPRERSNVHVESIRTRKGKGDLGVRAFGWHNQTTRLRRRNHAVRDPRTRPFRPVLGRSCARRDARSGSISLTLASRFLTPAHCVAITSDLAVEPCARRRIVPERTSGARLMSRWTCIRGSRFQPTSDRKRHWPLPWRAELVGPARLSCVFSSRVRKFRPLPFQGLVGSAIPQRISGDLELAQVNVGAHLR